MAKRVDEDVDASKQKKIRILLSHSPSGRLVDLLKADGYDVTLNVTDNFDIVLFAGMLPISPLLYGEPNLIPAYKAQPNFLWDRREWRMLHRLPRRVPKVGVGRGAHLLNAFNGGHSLQDVTGHAGIKEGSHKTLLWSGDHYELSSNHQQMMVPSDGATELAWAQKAYLKESHEFKRIYTREERLKEWDDVEMCHYWYTNSLCFEPIPYGFHKDTTDLFLYALDEFVQGNFDTH